MQNLKNDSLIYAIDQLEELKPSLIGQYVADLHHHLFNENYFIIGTHKAKQWLKNDYVSAAVTVQDYEQFNFGDISTRFDDPEKIANMLNYIFGSEILSESKIFNCLGGRLYEKLSSFTLDLIIRELKFKLHHD